MAMSSFERWAMPEIGLRAAAVGALGAEAANAAPSPEELAYARGHAEGMEAGAGQAEAYVRSALQALAGAAQSLRAVQAAFASEMEQNLYVLALAVARQIVQREVAADATIIHDLVRRAAETLPLDAALEIRLNPADLAALGSDPDLYGAGGRRLEVHWVAEPSIERGGYMIETPQRVIDGELDAALKTLYERLRDG
jgi:flagellar assembly protein FliH